MKKYYIYHCLIITALTFILAGCNKWEDPEFTAPEYTGAAPNKTVQDIIDKHVRVGVYQLDSICDYRDKFLVDGVVVSSDEGGNYYKSLVIQDETGGIEIQLNSSGLYNEFPVGQRVILDCRGLIVGDYHNKFQIGWEYETYSVGRIDALYIDKYLHKDGLPSVNNLPEALTVSEIDFTSYRDVNKLVKLENCQFAEDAWGKPFSYNDYTTEHELIVPGVADPIIVRTSNYAKFRSLLVPNTVGTLYGILTIYNSSYQLMIRTREDIQFEGLVDGGEESEIIQNFVFDDNSIGDGGWSVYPTESNYKWRYIPQNDYQAMYHQYNEVGVAMDDWLISPMIEVEDISNVALRLMHKNIIIGLQDYYSVYYTTSESSEFNPDDWHQLDMITIFPSAFSYSNVIDLSAIPSNRFRIAVRYNNNGGQVSSEWLIKNIEILNNNR